MRGVSRAIVHAICGEGKVCVYYRVRRGRGRMHSGGGGGRESFSTPSSRSRKCIQAPTLRQARNPILTRPRTSSPKSLTLTRALTLVHDVTYNIRDYCRLLGLPHYYYCPPTPHVRTTNSQIQTRKRANREQLFDEDGNLFFQSICITRLARKVWQRSTKHKVQANTTRYAWVRCIACC